MPIHQTGRQCTRDGRPFEDFYAWLYRLPKEQQQEYEQARQRQHAHRQDAIDRGDLIMLPDQSYVWKDQATMQKGKPQDEIWSKYHDRWAEENAIVSENIIEEI
jgi:hypothetical protein